MVEVESVVSLLQFIFSFNFYTLISWISVIGLSFRFLRKEYIIWKTSGVMDMQDDGDIIPILQKKDRRPMKCPKCGQPVHLHALPRPKILCTSPVFYTYILLMLLVIVLIVSSCVGAVVFPAYALYLSPYLPTQRNLNTMTNIVNRSSYEIVQDIFKYKNFTTDSIPIPDNYRAVLKAAVENGEMAFMNCSYYLEDHAQILSIIEEIKNITRNKDAILATFPPLDEILTGFNKTLYHYIDYLPIQHPLVKDIVTFFQTGDYTTFALKHFVTKHQIFTRDIMDLRIGEIVDIIMDPLSLITPTFINDIKEISEGMKQNVTVVGSDIFEKSVDVYNRGYALIEGFLNNTDLTAFEDILDDSLPVFVALQGRYVHYKKLVTDLISILPQFFNCMLGRSQESVGTLKEYIIDSYFDYFHIHFIYSTLVILVIVGLIALFVLMCIHGYKLAKETLAYAKSLIEDASMETIDAINDFGRTVKEIDEQSN